jgi:hypothetical protein
MLRRPALPINIEYRGDTAQEWPSSARHVYAVAVQLDQSILRK